MHKNRMKSVFERIIDSTVPGILKIFSYETSSSDLYPEVRNLSIVNTSSNCLELHVNTSYVLQDPSNKLELMVDITDSF